MVENNYINEQLLNKISVEQNVLVKKGIGTKEEPYILK